VVVDASNPRVWDDRAVLEFFRTSTGNLLAAERTARVRHHVVLSVVGCDVARGSGYLGAKLAQERLVETGPIPYTILRATQFFEFIDGIIAAARDGIVVRLPPVDMRPVAVADVVAALTELAAGPPKGGVVEIAGPEVFRMDELARRVLSMRGDAARVLTDLHATYFGARLEQRTLVPGADAWVCEGRLEDWLADSTTGR